MTRLLPGREALIAIGVCLIMAGIILRGIARAGRRDQAMRKQQLLDDPAYRPAVDPFSLWLERNVGWLSGLVLVVGLIATVAGYLRPS